MLFCFHYSWVGCEISLREWTLGVSDSRAAWIEGWLSKALEERSVDARELREALGRKVFMYGALVYGRPASPHCSRSWRCIPRV